MTLSFENYLHSTISAKSIDCVAGSTQNNFPLEQNGILFVSLHLGIKPFEHIGVSVELQVGVVFCPRNLNGQTHLHVVLSSLQE